MISDREQKSETMAMFTTSHIAQPRVMQAKRITCKHCGKIGHEEANCYELVGYPPGWNNRGGRGNRGRGRGVNGGRRNAAG